MKVCEKVNFKLKSHLCDPEIIAGLKKSFPNF